MIVYACVSRTKDGVILAETWSPEMEGNASEIMQRLLSRLVEIPEAMHGGDRMTFSQKNQQSSGDFFGEWVSTVTGGYISMTDDDAQKDAMPHFFHVLRKGTCYYACIGDDTEIRGQQVNFDFLENFAVDFSKDYSEGRIKRARALGFQKNFRRNIQSKLHFYNTNRESLCRAQNVQKVLDRIDDMKSVLNENIRLILETQEVQLANMTKQGDIMQKDSKVFKKQAEILLQSQKRKNVMRNTLYTIAAVGIIYLIAALVLGFDLGLAGVDAASSNSGN